MKPKPGRLNPFAQNSPNSHETAAIEALRLLDPTGAKAALIAEAELLLALHGVSPALPAVGEPFDDLAARLATRSAVEMLLSRLARALRERDADGARTAALRCWHELTTYPLVTERTFGKADQVETRVSVGTAEPYHHGGPRDRRPGPRCRADPQQPP